MTRSIPRLCCALIASLLLLPAAAQAAQITGDPLSISSGDEDGDLGASFTGSGIAEFFGSSVDTSTGAVSPAANAGFVVVTVDQNDGVDRYGSRHGNVTATSAPVVTGSGVPGDPFKIIQTFQGSDGSKPAVDIKQELSYVNGPNEFQAKLDVRNLTGGNLRVRVSMGADLAGGGNDRGEGLFEAGPPRFVAGLNTEVGAVAGLAEITSWSHYEEGQYQSVLARADGNPTVTRLQDTVDPNEVDNGAAVQWDQYANGLGAGQTASFEVAWRFARPYNLTPERQNLNTGDTAAFVASLNRVAGGAPEPGRRIRWSVTGSNSDSGEAITDQDGKAPFEYIGANPGTDRVLAYVDLNDNGQRDAREPQREATVEWIGPDAPSFAEEVNVRPVSGRVLVRLASNAKVKGKWAHAAQARFVRLEGALQIPVGSQIDVKKGRVSMTSAAGSSPTSGVQTSQFYGGRFMATQPRNARGMTEVRLTEAMRCRSGKGKLVASAVRRRQLWGRGKGRFRTRGRNSSATVRGTTWLQKDTCTTTTTVVREGTVIVRDFAKRKNIRVKAPRRYVARAKRR